MTEPWYDLSSVTPVARGARIAIVGAGIAGAAIADAMSRRGVDAVVFDPDGPAAGASGNPGGLVMPRLDLGDGAPATFFRDAYLFALEILARLDPAGAFFNRCGVTLKATDDEERARQVRLLAAGALPDAHMVSRNEGLHFPTGGVVDPRRYVSALLGDAEVRRERVIAIEQADDLLLRTKNSTDRFDGIVLANGREAIRLLPARGLPLTGVAGQIDHFPRVEPPVGAIAAGPYLASAPGGGILVGGTYDRIEAFATPVATTASTAENIAAAASLGVVVPADAESRPRAAVRCQTPDRLPVVGPLPDWGSYGGAYDDLRFGKRGPYPEATYLSGAFILAGLGSRGLVTAPFCAEILAAQMVGDAPPASPAVLAALHPARFFIRDYKRARPGKAIDQSQRLRPETNATD
ncbi:MAG: FAD-dependent 5-carboxymethylaminomethyl-2-thiouridine(34) oxidoreductase MnmC [Alphaproteobacteria bacterium]|nr:FAD-dependent 5-carboxymethylaminomethyl-2-thiouridine(34) oxidoreductase MnmC [Alphaproteobacteria bacterium]